MNLVEYPKVGDRIYSDPVGHWKIVGIHTCMELLTIEFMGSSKKDCVASGFYKPGDTISIFFSTLVFVYNKQYKYTWHPYSS